MGTKLVSVNALGAFRGHRAAASLKLRVGNRVEQRLEPSAAIAPRPR